MTRKNRSQGAFVRRARDSKGYALLAVVFMAALVALSLSVAMPSAWTRGRREMEVELLFRGNQYKRAIGLFFRKHSRFPMKIEELLCTNDRSYLRKEWPDPMTRSGEWRLLRLGPGGRIIGSSKSPKRTGPLGGSGTVGSSRPVSRGADSPTTQPIVGVASRSRDHSFRVFDGQETYYDWEFIFDPQEAAKKQGKAAQQQGRRPVNPLGRPASTPAPRPGGQQKRRNPRR